MNKLDQLVNRRGRGGIGVIPWLVAAIVIAGVAWAYEAELDEVAVAPGRIVPLGQIKVIQHLEGGIIEKLLVKDGQIVAVGSPLVQLDLGPRALNMDDAKIQLDGLLMARVRLDALADDMALKFPPELEKAHPDLARKERRLYQSSKDELQSRLERIDSQIGQRQSELRELGAKVYSLRQSLGLAKQKREIGRNLRKDKLMSRMEYLRLEQEVSRISGEINITGRTIARVRGAKTEGAKLQNEERARFQKALDKEIAGLATDIKRVKERLKMAQGQERRNLIKSPIAGIIKNLRYHTVGGVVRPGDAILEVVPIGDKLVVEVSLKPTDRGYVKLGQRATVKLSSYDFVRYGSLTGEVVTIAPDTTFSEDGNAFYKVVVETCDKLTAADGKILAIAPGMEATIDIHTGARTVWQYLLRPVLKLQKEAFRER